MILEIKDDHGKRLASFEMKDLSELPKAVLSVCVQVGQPIEVIRFMQLGTAQKKSQAEH